MKKLNNFLNVNSNLSFFFLIILFFSACTPIIKKAEFAKSPDIRVLLNTIENKDSLFFKGNYKLVSEEAEYEFGQQNNKIYIIPSSNSLIIYNDFRYLEYQKTKDIRLVSSSNNSRFKYKDKMYSGDIVFTHSKDSSVQLIDKLPLEEYLRGVVPSEIPSKESENFEAVKAQAICARTYAINKMNSRKTENFDVFSDTRDQVYNGADAYYVNSDKAIADTRGLILTFQNKPAVIYYHSTCGGKLEPVQNVFANGNLEYLSGGIDAVSDVISCSASPKFRWIETRTIDQLDGSFKNINNKNFIPGLNQISDTTQINLDLSILNRTETGRVQKLMITTKDTSVVFDNFQIRRFLGEPSGRPLPSTLFYLSQENDSTITIHGGGYGHGVGMCQWGAMNMSKKGFHYYHILNKYYPGTLLTKGY